ncbi:MAG TPA: fasciclin domain-containing protein [Niabella sp.]|nr:fasciclin domain-containing protein [Niabella sp.]HQX20865.1 fasciclin domain-containing protein [Niabella sp.]HQX41567.1 fasciclin domain-containing protein [Niabella sp.]HRB08345.1 fasciclin domain-containing protein [Niabella sp.]HRB48566.1 fasciclin domain-containing protein [Niabella sp.]
MKKNTILVLCLINILVMAGCNKVDNTYRNAMAPQVNFEGDAYAYLQSKPGVFDSLIKAIDRVPGLADTLRQKDITLFAPNNSSFQLALKNINQARQDSVPKMAPVNLGTIDPALLDSTLCKYIVRDKIISTDLMNTLSDGRDVFTVKYDYVMNVKLVFTNASGYVGGGPTLINFSDRNNSIFTRYWVITKTATIDIQASNAVINLLDAGHDFGFGSTFIRAVNKN